MSSMLSMPMEWSDGIVAGFIHTNV